METTELILIIFLTICNVLATIMIFLQKKGVLKVFLTQESDDFRLVSVGKILLFATILGAYVVGKYSLPMAAIYVLVFGGGYILIQILTKNKE